MGVYRVAELCHLATHAAGGGLARQSIGVVGGYRAVYHRVCLCGREYVLVGAAFLWRVVRQPETKAA